MQLNVKVPEVDTKVDEESDTVKTSFGRCQMEGSVAIIVTFLRISPESGSVRWMLLKEVSPHTSWAATLIRTNYQLDTIYEGIQLIVFLLFSLTPP